MDLTTKPNKFISSDGFTILVGKNNKQNDYVTFTLARGKDLWFHTKNIPGSHVILKTTLPQATASDIAAAVLLAAYFSKSRAAFCQETQWR